MTIDWNAQWEQHGHDFRDGYVHVDLTKFGANCVQPPLRLRPGPGFGDLSHPTTQLMLHMMAQIMPHEDVLDLGCGSGVLTLASVALGAKRVFGVDIDPEAVEHAKNNVALNSMQEYARLGFAKDYGSPLNHKPLLILMNMIWSEQIQAWNSLPQIHSQQGESIISGLLIDERHQYLSIASNWGWKLIQEKQMENWLCMHFQRS